MLSVRAGVIVPLLLFFFSQLAGLVAAATLPYLKPARDIIISKTCTRKHKSAVGTNVVVRSNKKNFTTQANLWMLQYAPNATTTRNVVHDSSVVCTNTFLWNDDRHS